MSKYLIALLFLFCLSESEAACVAQTKTELDNGKSVLYTGSCTEDNEVLITTDTDIVTFDACFVMSTTGAVDVVISLDGTNYSDVPYKMEDTSSEDTIPVLVTSDDVPYYFPVKAQRVRVLENGTTDAAASLLCFNYE